MADKNPTDKKKKDKKSEAGRHNNSDVLPIEERSIVLVGLMGVGKSTVGRRLGKALKLKFLDSDHEIEAAAGETIPEIFANRGEDVFRTGERKVITRLLNGPRIVLATGGGAFMNKKTREVIKARGISIWLKADLDVIEARVKRKDNRPLLKTGDPREILKRLMDERYPVYAKADLTVDSHDAPHEKTVNAIKKALKHYYRDHDVPTNLLVNKKHDK